MYKWKNFGDINFMEYGGCLVKEDDYPDCFHILSLTTNIYDYKGKYRKPVIVAKCYIDLSAWLENEEIKEVNKFAGYEEKYKPQTLEEKMSYCEDLIDYYGIQEFDPDFPAETGCGCYAHGTINKWIVGKTIAKRFMKEYGVPYEYRKG